MLTEDQLFEIKGKFLQQIPHPKLIQKQIDRLGDYLLEGMRFDNFEIEQHSDLDEFLKQYISVSLTLKLGIANAKDGSALLKSLTGLKNLQNILIKNLNAYYPENCTSDDSLIKQSDPFDAYEFFKELQAEKIAENEIKDYLCKQFQKDAEAYSDLAKGVLRARKIVGHG